MIAVPLLTLVAIGVAIVLASVRLRRGSPRQSDRDHTPRRQAHATPQVVGFRCAKCGETIIIHSEAAPCTTCGKPVHLACMPHAHEAAADPYRD